MCCQGLWGYTSLQRDGTKFTEFRNSLGSSSLLFMWLLTSCSPAQPREGADLMPQQPGAPATSPQQQERGLSRRRPGFLHSEALGWIPPPSTPDILQIFVFLSREWENYGSSTLTSLLPTVPPRKKGRRQETDESSFWTWRAFLEK